MKNHFLIIAFLLLSYCSFSQDKIAFKEYSYSEFFQMIEKEPSDVFTLKNALIVFDSIADKKYGQLVKINSEDYKNLRKDTINIYKELNLESVKLVPFASLKVVQKAYERDSISKESRQFVLGSMYHMLFHKKVTLRNCNLDFNDVVFKENITISYDSLYTDYPDKYRIQNYLGFDKCEFKQGILLYSRADHLKQGDYFELYVRIENSKIWLYKEPNQRVYYDPNYVSFYVNKLRSFELNNNRFYDEGSININAIDSEVVSITSNNFSNNRVTLWLARSQEIERLSVTNNTFQKPVDFSLEHLNRENTIDWKQFNKGIYTKGLFQRYIKIKYDKIGTVNFELQTQDSILYEFLEKDVYRFNETFKKQTKFLEKYKSHYKDQHDKEFENLVFLEIKNLETNRLGYLYKENPSFDRYFKWKVNQFLKVFSAYGTEPSKAITFSFYVIICFAFFYLFFPNYWDSHGKKRIMDRYRFFLKYVNKNSGIHEVYLEDKKPELLDAEDFKAYLLEHGKTAPKFFTSTALPLYRWSIAGTKTFSWLLSKVDVLKGTWSETSPTKQKWKAVLIFFAFFIAVCYDVSIKILNALMLSINTFTTLGFGEIPIKGLPRYLAIIQGFIGWFMLTIFSVSLISQLLN